MRHAVATLPALLPLRAVAFLGQVLLTAASGLRGRWRFPARDFGRVAADCSAAALPIVTVVNVLVGAILAFVGAVQLVKFGAGIYVADLVGFSKLRDYQMPLRLRLLLGLTKVPLIGPLLKRGS